MYCAFQVLQECLRPNAETSTSSIAGIPVTQDEIIDPNSLPHSAEENLSRSERDELVSIYLYWLHVPIAKKILT